MAFQPEDLPHYLSKDLAPHTGLKQYKCDILFRSILKKYVAPGMNDLLDRQAKDNFLTWNSGVRNTGMVIDWEQESLMRQWKDEIHLCFSEDEGPRNLDLVRALNYGYCGPGASRITEKNDLITKMFDSPLTYTSPFLYSLYKANISDTWREADASRHELHGTRVVEGSLLSTVPKDRTKNRTICTEPTLNMFYQLGVKKILENILEHRFHISMERQPDVNKSLARLASIDGSFATIDLKNASDSISMDLCRFLLPAHILRKLDLIRSQQTIVDGNLVELNMISTMGNGFTFPLMTLMFCALLKVAYRHCNLRFRNYYTTQSGRIFLQQDTTFGVFGDDIICRTEAVETVYDMLHMAGFVVNIEKSFTTGFFRESCGGDYYQGHDVRGIYFKGTTNETDIYSIFNRLHIWSVKHSIPLHNTLRWLRSECKFRPVPLHAGFDEGLLLPRKYLLSPKSDRNGALFYHAYRPVRFGWKIGESYRNPRGALIGFLGGYIRDSFVAARPRVTKYQVRKLKTPNWDYWQLPDVLRRGLEDSWVQLLE